jgi:DNA-directed RNA polymerase specialized sigma24 family protein
MADDHDNSVTWLIGELAGGDSDEAARQLWERYFDQIVRLARARLGAAPRGPADEEDVALSAFGSLCRGIAAGRFPRLSGRDELWRLLATITARKVIDQVQRESRQKRGGGRVRNESDLEGSEESGALGNIASPAPTPAFLAMMSEDVRRLFGLLPDETLRLIALLRLEGYTNEEAAASLGCAVRSVERKLERIRLLWTEAASAHP